MIYTNIELFLFKILQINLKTHFNFDNSLTEFINLVTENSEFSPINKTFSAVEFNLIPTSLEFFDFSENEKNLITILASNILKINILKYNKYYL